MSDHLLLLYKQNNMQPQATRSVMSALSSERNVSRNSTSWTVSTLACTFSLRVESCFSMSRFTFAETMSGCPPHTSIPTTYLQKIEALNKTSEVGGRVVFWHQLLDKLINNISRQREWTQAKISTSIPLDKLQDAGPSAEDCAVAPIAEKNLHIWQAMFSDCCTEIKTSRPGLSATGENHVPLFQSPGHRSFLHFLFSEVVSKLITSLYTPLTVFPRWWGAALDDWLLCSENSMGVITGSGMSLTGSLLKILASPLRSQGIWNLKVGLTDRQASSIIDFKFLLSVSFKTAWLSSVLPRPEGEWSAYSSHWAGLSRPNRPLSSAQISLSASKFSGKGNWTVLEVMDSGSGSFSVSGGRLIPLLMRSSRIFSLWSNEINPEKDCIGNTTQNWCHVVLTGHVDQTHARWFPDTLRMRARPLLWVHGHSTWIVWSSLMPQQT